MIKLANLILYMSFCNGAFTQEESSISNFVNKEIYLLDEIYNQEFFLAKTYSDTNYILFETTKIIQTHYSDDKSFDIIEYQCVLKPHVFDDLKTKDTMSYYLLKSEGKYYRLFGFIFSDFYIFEYNNFTFKRKEILSVIEKTRICKRKEMKKIRRHLNHSDNFFYYDIEFLRIIKHKNLNKMNTILLYKL